MEKRREKFLCRMGEMVMDRYSFKQIRSLEIVLYSLSKWVWFLTDFEENKLRESKGVSKRDQDMYR